MTNSGDGYSPVGQDYRGLYYSYMLTIVMAYRNDSTGHVPFYPDAGMPINEAGLVPDQRVAVPDQRVVVPDQRVVVPDQRVVVPDQRVTPDQKITRPDQQVATPDQQIAPNDQQIGPVDQQVAPNDALASDAKPPNGNKLSGGCTISAADANTTAPSALIVLLALLALAARRRTPKP